MLDLATYTPMGDKKNSDFFEEYLPRVYDRRRESGLNEIVGNTAAVVVQVSTATPSSTWRSSRRWDPTGCRPRG